VDDEDLVGRLLAGRYRVARKLGAGGMGTVWAAVQENLGREVALKVVRADLLDDQAAVERFHREARTVSTLQHPHIVGIYDFATEGPLQFIVMELLRGDTLRARLESRGRLGTRASIGVVRDVASALAAAHAAGVIHRDLKPDNVMLVEAAGRPDFVKILDFGVAKLLDAKGGARMPTLTQQGMMVGTPGYMAPELVLHGVTDDPRSDLYALGVLWFEMVVGRALFEANTAVGLVMKHATEPAPRPTEAAPHVEVPPQIEEVIVRLLAKDPADRPKSAAALVAALDELLMTAPNTPAPIVVAPPAPNTLPPSSYDTAPIAAPPVVVDADPPSVPIPLTTVRKADTSTPRTASRPRPTTEVDGDGRARSALTRRRGDRAAAIVFGLVVFVVVVVAAIAFVSTR
jgi:eukaryotic-like serine/threonine-protein kinase